MPECYECKFYGMLNENPTFSENPNNILLNPNDYRIDNPIRMQALKTSIKELGQLYPVIITNDFVVISGNARVIVCRELGIPVNCKFRNPEKHSE